MHVLERRVKFWNAVGEINRLFSVQPLQEESEEEQEEQEEALNDGAGGLKSCPDSQPPVNKRNPSFKRLLENGNSLCDVTKRRSWLDRVFVPLSVLTEGCKQKATCDGYFVIIPMILQLNNHK